jgi:hypothetical protein
VFSAGFERFGEAEPPGAAAVEARQAGAPAATWRTSARARSAHRPPSTRA